MPVSRWSVLLLWLLPVSAGMDRIMYFAVVPSVAGQRGLQAQNHLSMWVVFSG